jgi:hypothetical protein
MRCLLHYLFQKIKTIKVSEGRTRVHTELNKKNHTYGCLIKYLRRYAQQDFRLAVRFTDKLDSTSQSGMSQRFEIILM